ncbi:MAG: ROK family protein [Endomicrobia bacterium]|nr:ROK family protein [Endomicrobiia bacterium]MCL2507220.1 ROK family protein [Endomicrobiia bacterium]
MSKEQFYLGIDMGGTHVKIAIVNSLCNIVEETVIDTDITAKPLDVIKTIISKASKLKNYSKVECIGVGIAGDVNCFDGSVRFSPNLPKWKNVALKQILEKLTKKKAFVDNDANTASIGAFWLDAKAKPVNLVCVTLGTGVGGGLIFNKKLYRGSSCTAGEIGHITVDPSGHKCKCGNKGCVETFVGAKYISKYAVEYLKTHKSPIIDKLVNGDHSKITPKVLSLAAAKGDKAAIAVWSYIGEKLGILFACIVNFVNPDAIVLCGGVSHAGKYLIEPAKREMKSRAFASAVKKCKIVISKYTNKLGVVGAAMLPKL